MTTPQDKVKQLRDLPQNKACADCGGECIFFFVIRLMINSKLVFDKLRNFYLYQMLWMP